MLLVLVSIHNSELRVERQSPKLEFEPLPASLRLQSQPFAGKSKLREESF